MYISLALYVYMNAYIYTHIYVYAYTQTVNMSSCFLPALRGDQRTPTKKTCSGTTDTCFRTRAQYKQSDQRVLQKHYAGNNHEQFIR